MSMSCDSNIGHHTDATLRGVCQTSCQGVLRHPQTACANTSVPQQDGISALRCNTYAGNHPRTIGLSGSSQWYLGPEVQWLALTAVVVRMDSLFWADSTLMKRRMSSCMVMPWSVVYRVI